jgi:RimJ/RimL family protein N-acetyltransferase
VNISGLHAPIVDGDLALEPMAERHRAGLAAACAADADIWAIYTSDWSPAGFDANFAALLADPRRLAFAIVLGGRVIGMTCFLDAGHVPGVVEIGGTYMAPDTRATGLNARIKRLLIARAAACGVHRAELRIDTRNTRSMAAAEKLGAVREGVLRRHRFTWTGHLRDTALYALFPDEWLAGRAPPA